MSLKLFLFVLISVFLSSNTLAGWEQFQNDEFNNGKANGTGYFNDYKPNIGLY